MRKIQVNAEKVSRTGLIIALIALPLVFTFLVFVIGYVVRAFVG